MVKKIILLLFLFTSLFAQQKEDQRSSFSKAVELFRNEQYLQANQIFTTLARDKTFSLKIPSEIFIGKILLKQGKQDEAEKLFDNLKRSVKDSVYRLEILLTKSVILYSRGEYFESAEELLELINSSGSSSYYSYAKNSLDTVVLNHLSSEQVNILIDISKRELTPLLQLLLGKSYLAEGDKQKAKESFLKVMKEYSSSPLRKEAEDYFYERKTIKVIQQTEPLIALIFPQGSSDDNSVNEITEGVKYAVHEFNSSREDRIGLISLDFNQAGISEIKNEVLSLNTKCVIGPVYSDDVRLILNEFKGIKIPLISPTATDNDLTLLNEYFFQANPNFTLRAKAMAQYIFYVENKRKLGVMNSIEGYSPLMSAIFVNEFKDLGGDIVINITFKSRSTDFNEQASKISDVIQNIEGIYIPVSDKDDITPLLSSFSKYNLSVPIYGNQDWFLGKGYETFPALNNNLVFESDYFIDYSSYNYNSFNEEFTKRTGMEAERNVLYGYDITKYFLNQMTKINAGPEIIASRMMNENIMTGYHNNICFDEERVNKFVNIIRYRDGVFELIDKFKTAN